MVAAITGDEVVEEYKAEILNEVMYRANDVIGGYPIDQNILPEIIQAQAIPKIAETLAPALVLVAKITKDKTIHDFRNALRFLFFNLLDNNSPTQ